MSDVPRACDSQVRFRIAGRQRKLPDVRPVFAYLTGVARIRNKYGKTLLFLGKLITP
jgi:hypothetical protein